MTAQISFRLGRLAKIKDIARYTFVFPDKDYAVMAERAIAQLKADGFRLADNKAFKNYWEINNDALKYKGVNIGMYDPATGLKFELQLHAEASVIAKEAEHGWYNWTRIPDVTDFEEKAATVQTNEIFGVVEIPDQAKEVKWGLD